MHLNHTGFLPCTEQYVFAGFINHGWKNVLLHLAHTLSQKNEFDWGILKREAEGS